MIAEDAMECSHLSLYVDTRHPVEVKESSNMFCSCTEPNRRMCKGLNRGCSPGKCKFKNSKCFRLKEKPVIDMEVLGELHSSEDFCICKDSQQLYRSFMGRIYANELF